MEAVIFIGIQATGKSTFYLKRFFKTHIRINLDMLKTRNREKELFLKCLEIKQPLVVDNTNPTRKDRQRYIPSAKEHGFKITGYYFRSKISDALERNQKRTKEEVIPEVGIRATFSKLELPSLDEGFDELFYVYLDENNRYAVEEWKDD
jgi:predicted kinase